MLISNIVTLCTFIVPPKSLCMSDTGVQKLIIFVSVSAFS